MNHEPGKEPLPQTVEALQEAMARDNELLMEQDKLIRQLTARMNTLTQQRDKYRRLKSEYKKALSYIANSYIELSADKARLQRDDYITLARKTLAERKEDDRA